MGNILMAKARIRGIRPLWWHRFGPDSIPLEKQERTGVAGNDPEEWRKTALVTKEGQLYLDPSYVFGTVRDGAKHTARKRGSLQPYVAATLQVVDDRILIDRFMPDANGVPYNLKTAQVPPEDPDAPVYLDVRSVKNPATKARNVRYRVAASSGWEAEFTLMWDKTVVSRGEMESALRDAGRLVGLGDGRSIGAGRFEVVSFEAVDA